MRSFLEAIAECSPDSSNWLLQIVEGSGCGERAIVTNGEYVYLSDPAGVISRHREEWMNPGKSGIRKTEDGLLYTEQFGAEKKLVICGAGHVSLPVIRLGKMTGFHVTVADDREHFAAQAKSAGADETVCADFETALESIQGDKSTYFVIVTRGHAHDEACLRAILKKTYAYVGMMGSRRRIEMVRSRLAAEGWPRETVEGIHAPIGLPIHAETPEEIAVSILGEIIGYKNQNKETVFPQEILNDLLGLHHTEPLPGRKILCTIIDRSGSAPRSVGTRMLLTSEGKQLGTIGGGLLEYRVRKKAEEMFRPETPGTALLHLELTAGEEAEEGEVCGGRADILLEEIYSSQPSENR